MIDKSELRHHMRHIREEAAARDPDAADKLADVFPLKLLERYGPVVAGYLKIGDEMDPTPLMRKLAAAGAETCLPRVEAEGRLSFRLWAPGEPLDDGPHGLREPAADAPLATPTLLLTPALAIDGAGQRLGYGKGYYDRALAELRAKGRAFACALVYRDQMIETVPAEPHDQVMDWAITEAGSIPLFMMNALKPQSE